MGLLLVLTVSGLVFGAIGVAIARNKNVDGTTGFLLGAFLGPLGLIIVALLNPTVAKSRLEYGDRFSGQSDLTSDAYRLWLTKKYDISRNELFDKYIYNENIYDSLDAVIAYVHEKEIHTTAEEAAAKLRALKSEAIQKERRALQRTEFAKKAKYIVPVLAVVGAMFAYGSKLHDENEADKKAQLERDRKVVSVNQMREQLRLELAPYGMSVHPGTIISDEDYYNPSYKDDRKDRSASICQYPVDKEPHDREVNPRDLINAGGRRISIYIDKKFDAGKLHIEMRNNLIANGFRGIQTASVASDGQKNIISSGQILRNFYSFKGGNYVSVETAENRSGPTYVRLCFGEVIKDPIEEAAHRVRL